MNKNSIAYSFFAVVAAVIVSYHFFDLPIALYFHARQDSILVTIASLVTQLGEGIYYIIPSLILYLIWRKRRPIYGRIALFIFLTTSISGILVNIFKLIFGRFRPKMYFNEQLFGFEWFHFVSTNSFPSGHSATAMGAWLAFALLLPKYRYPLILIGILIVSTRIIVTAHYLGDTIAGSYLGAMVTLICYRYMYTNAHQAVKV